MQNALPAQGATGWYPHYAEVDSIVRGPSLDGLPLAVPGTITWTGTAWPARTTVTSQAGRRVIWIGNPGGSKPTDMADNDVWTQG